jgi:eight-cysteine-cluster-containing protein
VQFWCKTHTLPVLKEGCEFNVAATDGYPGGSVWVSKTPATLNDYLQAYQAFPGIDETMELKPRSTRREAYPFTYFFWFTSTDLITIKAHQAVCKSDYLKQIAIEVEQGVKAAPTCEQLGCHNFTYSTCPEGCNKECIPSAATPTGMVTVDCEGAGSCRCIGEPRPAGAPLPPPLAAPLPSEPFCGRSLNDSCSVDADCVVGGCSSQVCGAAAAGEMTTCEWRDCYKADAYNLACKCVASKCQWANAG